MKITYEFDTGQEDFDKTELTRFEKSLDMAYALCQLDEEISSWVCKEEPLDPLEIESMFNNILRQNNIDLDEVIQ